MKNLSMLMSRALQTALIVSLCWLIVSCSKDDTPEKIPLKANAGADGTGAVGTVVNLDGSASTGPVGTVGTWTLESGPVTSTGAITINNINFIDVSGFKGSFTPPVNGSYTFKLRLTSGTEFSEDQVTVVITGAITLTGTHSGTDNLKDIEPGTGPDYILTGDFTIPSGTSLATPITGQIVIAVNDNAAIIVDGGTLSGTLLKFTSSAGWKGIWLKSGNLNLTGASSIEKAGKSTHTGQSETAAVLITGGSANLSTVTFTSTTGYDILIPAAISNIQTIASNFFSATVPIKAPIQMLPQIEFNSFGTYNYIHLTTPNTGVVIASIGGSSGFLFRSGVKYLIDGDLNASSVISAQSATALAPTTILVKAGSGILANGGVNVGSNVIFDGQGGAAWKGIAIGNNNNGNTISGATIKNAGSAVFNTGTFTSDFKASIYFFATSGNGGLSNSTILNSGGYGLYNASPTNYMTVQSSTFTNTTLAAIYETIDKVHAVISTTNNTFTMNANTAAVEVKTPNSNVVPLGTWQALGATNYYLFTGNVYSSTTWTLKEGVNLRFGAGKFLNNQSGLLTAIGTAALPITFDSQAGTAGSWAGILVESVYKFEYCQVRNGGDSFLMKGGVTPATEKANIVFNYGGVTVNSFKNNTVSGSAGYGLLVEATKQNPDALNAGNANSFSSNVSGNVIVK